MYVEIITNNIEEEGLLFKSLLEMRDRAKTDQIAIDFMPNRGAAVFFEDPDPNTPEQNLRSVLIGFGTRALKNAKIKGTSNVVNGDVMKDYDSITKLWASDLWIK